MRIYEPQHVPELLQTPAYAEALLRAGLVGREADELPPPENAARVGRPDRADPPRLTCVLGESALRSPVGGPHVLGEQLNALVTLAQRNTIDIHVLPDSAGRPAGASGAFTTLSLPPEIIQDFPGVVYVTTPVDRIHYESPDSLAVFHTLWERVREHAMSARTHWNCSPI